MAQLMKAAAVDAFGEPLRVQEVQVPTPGSGQIFVNIKAPRVCYTDLHAADGDWPVKPTLPFIPRHEGVGFVAAVDASTTDPDAVIQKEIGGAHGVPVTAVSRGAFAQALGVVRRGGTVAPNGLPPGHFLLPIFATVLNGITVRGSIVGTRRDLQESLEFAADGRVRARIHRDRLGNMNAVLADLKGEIDGRVVLALD
jgi:D-arabinose 1-dehydrogenase-like Zn-dependent alcohol dehydrogenase